MWKLSKCVHIAGVGFVSRPWANVSAASRWLKSSGSKEAESERAEEWPGGSQLRFRPVQQTARPLRCASHVQIFLYSGKLSITQTRPGECYHGMPIRVAPNSIAVIEIGAVWLRRYVHSQRSPRSKSYRGPTLAPSRPTRNHFDSCIGYGTIRAGVASGSTSHTLRFP